MIGVWLAAVTVIALGALAVAFTLALTVNGMREQVDRADDTSDLALGKVQAVENHLTGIEPPGVGRHAHSGATAYRKPPVRPAP